MELAFFLKDKKTPLLPPRLAHVVGQFTATQAGDGISTGGDESHIHVDVMAPGLVGDFRDGRPRVLIAPSVPHLAEEFPLKNCCISSLYVSMGQDMSLSWCPRFPLRREEWRKRRNTPPCRGEPRCSTAGDHSHGNRGSDTRPLTMEAGVHTGQIAHA
jgi:hypothetical protein